MHFEHFEKKNWQFLTKKIKFFKLKFHAQNIIIIHSAYILMHFDTFWCILMHFSLSKCNKNNCFDNWLYKKFILMHSEHFEKNRSGFNKKMNFLHLVLSAQNVSICIRMHQNVCSMNCANVLCTKLSKKWFLFNKIG